MERNCPFKFNDFRILLVATKISKKKCLFLEALEELSSEMDLHSKSSIRK